MITGGVLSRCHVDDPLADLPLVENTVKFAVPLPSGNGRLHELPHVKGTPFRSPLIATSNPCGSLAVNSRISLPLHQPISPHRSQITCPVIVGGRGVGVGEGVFVAVYVGVKLGVGVNVNVAVAVLVGVNVGVKVKVGVFVMVGVRVMVGVNVGVCEGVGVAVEGGPI